MAHLSFNFSFFSLKSIFNSEYGEKNLMAGEIFLTPEKKIF